MAAVLDLDARRAQRAEATAEPLAVRLGGEDFEFLGISEWPVEIIEVISAGNLVGALRLLLTEEDAARFFAQRPTMADLSDLFDGLGTLAGVGNLGNSSDSAKS